MGIGKLIKGVFSGKKTGKNTGELKGEITDESGKQFKFKGTFEEIPARQDGCNPSRKGSIDLRKKS